MAFESLSDKLQNIFKNLRGKGRLSEADVKAALKEVKMALLEADVSFKVVKQFISSIQERAVGEEVFGSLTPGQTVIKIVTEELVKLMGSETTEIDCFGNRIFALSLHRSIGLTKSASTAGYFFASAICIRLCFPSSQSGSSVVPIYRPSRFPFVFPCRIR